MKYIAAIAIFLVSAGLASKMFEEDGLHPVYFLVWLAVICIAIVLVSPLFVKDWSAPKPRENRDDNIHQ